MGEPITWDLLVHPFFSLACIEDKLPKHPSPRIRRVLLKNAKVLDAIWKARVKFLALRPDRGIIILRPAFRAQIMALESQGVPGLIGLAKEGDMLCEGLTSFALEKLGRGRCVLARSGIGIQTSLENIVEERGLRAGPSIGAVMGEYNNWCVKVAAEHFAKITGQKVRIAPQKGIFSLGEGRRNVLSDLGKKHRAAVQRMKKIRIWRNKA